MEPRGRMVVNPVHLNQELPGGYPRSGPLVGSRGKRESMTDEPWLDTNPDSPPPKNHEVVCHQEHNRDHHICSRLQPQSQLKYKQSVIESMKDEVMRTFIKPPPNRIIICCDCSCSCNCRHRSPNHSSSPFPSSPSPTQLPPTSIGCNSRGVNVKDRIPSTKIPSKSKKNGYRELSNSSDDGGGQRLIGSEPVQTPPSRSSSFTSTSFLIASGLRKGSKSKTTTSKSGDEERRGSKSDSKNNNNNNNNNNSHSSSPSNLIHSYFQSSNLIPTIFLSSSKSSRSSPTASHGTSQPLIKGCQ